MMGMTLTSLRFFRSRGIGRMPAERALLGASRTLLRFIARKPLFVKEPR